MKSHEVVFKKDGRVKKEVIKARNQSAAVEKIKKKHRTTHILKVRKPKVTFDEILNKLLG